MAGAVSETYDVWLLSPVDLEGNSPTFHRRPTQRVMRCSVLELGPTNVKYRMLICPCYTDKKAELMLKIRATRVNSVNC